MRLTQRTRTLAITAVLGALTLSGCASSSGEAADEGNKDAPFIALSNGFIGNGWRQTLVRSFEENAAQLQEQGLIGKFQAVNAPGDNNATEQISQIRSLILQQPDALLIVPASSTALVPVVEEACAADIEVIILDASMEAPCAHTVRNAYDAWGADSLTPGIEAIGGTGTIIVNRGVVGSQPEELFHETQLGILKEHPGIKVAAEINGFCDSSTVQQQLVSLLASLPEIDAVPGCAGGTGVAQAFTSAGREIPVVVFDTNGQSLQFWKDQKIENGSYAVMTDPAQSVAATFFALNILNGDEVPEEIILPLVTITQDQRDTWLATLGPDDYATYPWSAELIDAAIKATEAGETVATPAFAAAK